MKKITVKKLKHEHIEVLQQELKHFSYYTAVTSLRTDFLNAITALDIAATLHYVLRNKIEQDKKLYTIGFSLTQAAIILKCCNYKRLERDDYVRNVMTSLVLIIDPQLISVINNREYTQSTGNYIM